MTGDGHICKNCCMTVRTPQERCIAIQSLVDGNHVWQHLPHVKRLVRTQGGSTAKAVGAWLNGRIRNGTLRYIPDPSDRDIWSKPTETLRRGGGDCDDFSVLAASLFRGLKRTVDVAVGHQCTDGICIGHAWVEGHDEKGWFMLEATSGQVWRTRPAGYTPLMLLRPGRCEAV